MLSKLLDFKTIELEGFLNLQQPILDQGVKIEIVFTKKIQNLPIKEIVNLAFDRNFIVETPNHSSLIQNIYRYEPKKNFSYRYNNPFYIKSNEMAQVYLSDSLENPTFKLLVLEEVVGTGHLTRNHLIFRGGSTIKEYLTEPEKIEIINKNKKFFLIFEGLKQAGPIADYSDGLREVYGSMNKFSKEKFLGLYNFYQREENKSILSKSSFNKINKIYEMISDEFYNSETVFEFIKFYDIYRNLMHKAHQSLAKDYSKINLKRYEDRIVKAREKCEKYKTIKPYGEVRRYSMSSPRENFSLSALPYRNLNSK